MIREFFYLQKSDRKVILSLLAVIVIALCIIFLTGGQNDESNALTPADSADSIDRNRPPRDTARRYRQPYVRTRVVYRDRPERSHSRGAGQGSLTSSAGQTGAENPPQPRHYPVKICENEHVILNTADTATLMTVPGIGPYYAKEILRYGQRLGGYVSVSQLDEIDDFPSESKKYFVIDTPSPTKLNVNRLSLNELRRHPYINFYQARAITDYRRLHGPLHSLNDLRLSKDFSQEAIDRLLPYVEY